MNLVKSVVFSMISLFLNDFINFLYEYLVNCLILLPSKTRFV